MLYLDTAPLLFIQRYAAYGQQNPSSATPVATESVVRCKCCMNRIYVKQWDQTSSTCGAEKQL